MQFICDQATLNETLVNVSRIVPLKSAIPQLEGIKFTIKDNVLNILGYDLEMGISKNISVNADGDVSIVMNSRLICEIVRKMPSGDIKFSIDDNFNTSISSGKIEYTISCSNADDFPSIPSSEGSELFSISQSIFKNMIEQTIYAIATVDIKPILTGELFAISQNTFELVAVDGYRLAIRKEKVTTDDRFNFVLRGKSLSEISKLLKEDSDKNINLHISRKHVIFEFNDYSFFSRILEGDFYKYDTAFVNNYETEVVVNTKEIIGSLERCLLLINDKNRAPVRCTFNDGKLSINCKTALGEVFDEITIDTIGPAVNIGFNCKYFLDALKASQTDKVRMFMKGGVSPMKITPLEGDAYTYLVLPVRIR